MSEMNGLEVDFLFRINFSLHVTPDLFEKYKAELVSHSANAALLSTNSQSQHQQQLVTEIHASQNTLTTHHPNLCAVSQSNLPLANAQIPMSAPQPPPPTTHHHHHHAPQVTPSPSHAAPRNATAPYMDQRRVDDSTTLLVTEHLFSNSVTQQYLQRAQSLPPQFPGHPGRCAHNPPFSAPMVSMLPAGLEGDQYLVLNNHIFPIQTTLVHHHHGVDNYHEQNSFHHQRQHANAGYAIGRDVVGSLVAGHY